MLTVCTRCVMDTTDREIRFDEAGVCNHCHDFDNLVKPRLLSPERAAAKFATLIAEIKQAGQGRKYDCVLGISGGVDSSYLAYLAKTHGLRTLLVHMDNSWDSELAVQNIENIVRTTGFDYYNHVIEWEEFRDLQLAYLRASVVDVEVVTDHAITALVYQLADRFGIKYILNGGNVVSESVMPRHGWYFPNKNDLTNLRAIHKRYGTRALKSYPTLGLYRLRYYQRIKHLQYVDLLNYVSYRLADARRTLEHEFGWRYYGGKHFESVFTKFYQAYILPRKFNVDKRKPHLSALVCSGQITRDEALARLQQPIYTPAEQRAEYEYAVKKLGLTAAQFEEIMALPVVPHEAFPTEKTALFYRLKQWLWPHARR